MTEESFTFFFIVYLLYKRCPFVPSVSFLKSGEHKVGLRTLISVKEFASSWWGRREH